MCYIGQTVKSFERREWEHLNDLRKGKHPNRRLQGIYRKCLELGFGELSAELIEEVNDGRLHEREIHWIAEGRRSGLDLCNFTDGGEGGQFQEETKAELAAISRARWASPEYQARHEAWRARRKGMTVEEYRVWVVERDKPSPIYLANKAKAEARKAREAEEKAMWATLTPLTVNGYACVPLTKGAWALVTERDYAKVAQYKWHSNVRAGEI